ncbi:MAG: RidA family protein [Bacteroidia bacterium]|nr:RidA family protein [Bacteroidia bacterium]NNC84687.1 RidA family protein [Bacteroidia bacterium]
MERKKVSSGTTWEEKVGYSRAIQTGNYIEVSGTTAVVNNEVVCIGDAYGQTKFIFNIIENALNKLGATLSDVVRTRMYVTDISKFEDYTKAHGEFFKDVRPAATLVEVSGLVHPNMLIEIEVTAIKDD